MSWLDGLRTRVRFLARRRHTDAELAEELAFHHEQALAELIAVGLDHAGAERAAHLRFGGRDRFREESRDEWAGPFAGLGQDLHWTPSSSPA